MYSYSIALCSIAVNVVYVVCTRTVYKSMGSGAACQQFFVVVETKKGCSNVHSHHDDVSTGWTCFPTYLVCTPRAAAAPRPLPQDCARTKRTALLDHRVHSSIPGPPFDCGGTVTVG